MTVKKCLINVMEGGGSKRGNEQGEQRAIDRMRWLQLQEEHSDLPKTELRKSSPDLYARLYRNDRSWLEKNSPAPKKMTFQSQRVDWVQRDKEILLNVQSAVDEMISAQGKPHRVTISKVGAKCGVKALLEKHLDRLPETKAYLIHVLETEEQFRLRKIRWAIKQLEGEGEQVLEWKVLRRAGIRPENVRGVISDFLQIIRD